MYKKLAFFVCVSAFLFMASCKKSNVTLADPDLESKVFSSYTRGIVNSNSLLKYVFSMDMVDDDQVGKLIENKLVSISPEVAGTNYWESKNTLVFKPTGKLKPGASYQVKVDLKSISPTLTSGMQTFNYTIQTREMSFVVERPQIELGENDSYNLVGKVQTSDFLDQALIEKLIFSKNDNSEWPVEWQHQPENLTSYFTVKKIPKTITKLELNWDGSPANINKSGSHIINLPPAGIFTILDVVTENDPEKRIVTSFTENLKSNQNLEGLIYIKGKEDALRNVIDGNKVYSYFNSNLSGEVKIEFAAGISSAQNKRLTEPATWDVSVSGTNPMIRFVGKGNIIPQTNETMLPFEAIGLKAVDVEIFKIFDHNILQFLQTNELNDGNELYRVGRVISQKKIELNNEGSNMSINNWAHYALDLGTLIKTEPNAIYQIRIGFKPSYTFMDCAQSIELPAADEEQSSFYEDNYYGIGGYYPGYDYEDRDDPCKPAYYNYDHFIARNVLVSNIGIIAKVSDKDLFTAVSDLRSAEPIAGAVIDVYNFQLEKIARLTSNDEGIAQQSVSQVPYALIISYNGQKGYLRLADGGNLNMSAFDIDGQEVQKGMKGYLFAERGVWRPGDSIHLNFILNELNAKLPAGHPVQLKVFDPQGKLMVHRISNKPTGAIYSFSFKTSPDDLTGSWRATISAGGATFSKSLMIEAVKPNRLKIQFDAGDEIFPNQSNISLKSNWLTGLMASGLSAKVTSKWNADYSGWASFKDFAFQDPARNGNEPPETTLFEGALDETGETSVPMRIAKDFKPSGKMRVRFNVEVSEPSGDFSTYSNTSLYHPYKNYVGIRLPDDQWGYKTLNINKSSTIQFASIDAKGKSVPGRKLTIGLYELEWRWWWEQRENAYADFNTTDHKRALHKATLITNTNGLAEWKVKINNWGRYLIRVCDTESGHCAGDFAYAGWPEDDDGAGQFDMATLLKIQSDKEKYKSNETIKLNIPAPALSKMLITFENGSRVLESHWVKVDKTPFVYTIQASSQMAPAVYAHVSLMQPHGNNNSDMPLRMYGVMPIYIENGESKLEPKINTASAFKPEKLETIEISESSGRPMSYILNIVDDGLLDLTNFKTPDPYAHFFSKEALGVRTWDLYDQVMGAFGGKLESVLSIGGDEGLLNEKSAAANRFKSPVIHLGPFELKKGEKKKHEIQIKNYVGSVRVMAIAGGENAYGNAEKTIAVKSAVMVLPTLPRVISIGEKITMPVNIFISDPSIKNVSITAKDKNNQIQFASSSQSLVVDKEGEQMVYFSLDAPMKPGKSNIIVEAKAGNETVRNEVELETRNPNPFASEIKTIVIEPGVAQKISLAGPPSAINLTGMIEVSTFEPVNMNKYLDDLIQYPYGCAEQTISAAFPQLYLENMVTMDATQSQRAKINIEEAIAKISKFNLPDGSFSMWPGVATADLWVTSYIGHFLIEAQKKGYAIPEQLLNKWKGFQKRTANTYNPNQRVFYKPNHGLDQAYRLYSLALAGSADIGAMNRLKEYTDLGNNAKWRLATTYAISGQIETAKSLINKVPDLSEYVESGYSYGSPLRDQAMVVETYMAIGDKSNAASAAIQLSKQLNSGRQWNTQGLAYALQSLSRYKGNAADGSTWSFKYHLDGGNKQSITSKLSSFFIDPQLASKKTKDITIENTSAKPIFVQSTVKGQPMTDTKGDEGNGIKLTVKYMTENGVEVDPSTLKRGERVNASISVTHLGIPSKEFGNLALSHIIPAGWEILNERMNNNESPANYIYQDIRDDRIFTFFKLNPGQSKTLLITLRATYSGNYNLPAITCEDMYDAAINARIAGGKVSVE